MCKTKASSEFFYSSMLRPLKADSLFLFGARKTFMVQYGPSAKSTRGYISHVHSHETRAYCRSVSVENRRPASYNTNTRSFSYKIFERFCGDGNNKALSCALSISRCVSYTHIYTYTLTQTISCSIVALCVFVRVSGWRDSLSALARSGHAVLG